MAYLSGVGGRRDTGREPRILSTNQKVAGSSPAERALESPAKVGLFFGRGLSHSPLTDYCRTMGRLLPLATPRAARRIPLRFRRLLGMLLVLPHRDDRFLWTLLDVRRRFWWCEYR